MRIIQEITDNPYVIGFMLLLVLVIVGLLTPDKHPSVRTIVVEDLKQVSRGNSIPDLFVITKDREIINLRYSSGDFAKLQIGDTVEITEFMYSTDYKVISK